MGIIGIFRGFDSKKILDEVNKRHLPSRIIWFLVGIFIMALAFNICFAPNNLISGGVSGLSIVVADLTNVTASTFIIIMNMFLVVLSLLTLGKNKSIANILGAVAFSFFVYITQDINNILHVEFDNMLLYVLTGAVLNGFASGLVFRTGFSSGGTDILGMVVSKYLKRPLGKTLLVINTIIIIIGGFVFGYTNVIYAVIINYISTLLTDKILLGISDSKMFLIDSVKEDEIKEFIMDVMESGVTVLKSKGGFTKDKKDMLMCIVSTSYYFALKEAIKKIDPDAFIVVSDCYEVHGGTKKSSSFI